MPHELFKNCKAVLFDMDGVLFDSMKFHAVSWKKVMTENGIPFEDEDCYMCEGRTGASTIKEYFLKVKGVEATEDDVKRLYSAKVRYFTEFGKIDTIPYAKEVVQHCVDNGKKILIVTGSGQQSLIETVNREFNNLFSRENMVTAFDVKKGKPDPEPYLMALQKAGVTAEEAIVVENAPLGVQSAIAAGIKTIAVNTGPLPNKILKDHGATIVLDSMEDFYKTIQQ